MTAELCKLAEWSTTMKANHVFISLDEHKEINKHLNIRKTVGMNAVHPFCVEQFQEDQNCLLFASLECVLRPPPPPQQCVRPE